MSKPQSLKNPFYGLLIVVGVAFVLTACAYFTMTIREASPKASGSSGFTTLVANHGMTALMVELVLLAIATFGAMVTDDYWNRRVRPSVPVQDETKTSD